MSLSLSGRLYFFCTDHLQHETCYDLKKTVYQRGEVDRSSAVNMMIGVNTPASLRKGDSV